MNYLLRRYELLGLCPNMNYALRANDFYCASARDFAKGKYFIVFTPISIGIQTARQGKLDRHRRVSKPPRKGETAGAAGD